MSSTVRCEVKREDSEYERHRTSSLFVTCEPLAGTSILSVSKRRTKADWAEFVRDLIDVQYPQAEKIALVVDNLNTHTPSSFYEVFAPKEAKRLTEKLEIHYTQHPWELVKYGGNRTVSAGSSVFVRANEQHAGGCRASSRLAAGAQSGSDHHQLAFYRR